MANINTAVSFMEQIAADNSHGYDQYRRNGGIDYDCSSLVGTALKKAGFKISASSTTRNLYTQLKACGFKTCSKPWKRGDIHLSIGHHIVMSTGASKIVHASINENGRATGGKPGDQTGKEICVRSYYEHSSGWDYHLRYVGTNSVATNTAISEGGYDMPTIKKGSKGKAVKIWQIIIGANVDGDFGSKTESKTETWQKAHGLKDDGIVGHKSWKAGLDSV